MSDLNELKQCLQSYCKQKGKINHQMTKKQQIQKSLQKQIMKKELTTILDRKQDSNSILTDRSQRSKNFSFDFQMNSSSNNFFHNKSNTQHNFESTFSNFKQNQQKQLSQRGQVFRPEPFVQQSAQNFKITLNYALQNLEDQLQKPTSVLSKIQCIDQGKVKYNELEKKFSLIQSEQGQFILIIDKHKIQQYQIQQKAQNLQRQLQGNNFNKNYIQINEMQLKNEYQELTDLNRQNLQVNDNYKDQSINYYFRHLKFLKQLNQINARLLKQQIIIELGFQIDQTKKSFLNNSTYRRNQDSQLDIISKKQSINLKNNYDQNESYRSENKQQRIQKFISQNQDPEVQLLLSKYQNNFINY